MNFSAPAFFGLAALAAPIVVMYILKVRRRRVSVPYLRIWEDLLVETRARSLFQRLKRIYSLLLQLLILAAIILGLTQPAFELTSVEKESIVLMLDTSASMLTREGEAGEDLRFDLMIDQAREVIEGRSYEDEMMVVAVSDRVDVLTSFNRSTLRLRDALQRAQPTKRRLDLQRAYDFANQITSGRENPVVLFVSDGGAGEFTRIAGEDAHAALLPVGAASSNVGITRFSARKNTSLGTDYVLATFQNFGLETVEVRYELTIKEPGEPARTAKVMDVELEPGEEHREDWEFRFPAGANLILSIASESDRLSVDDRAWAIVRSTRLRKVVLVAEDVQLAADYFGTALGAMADVISDQTFATTPQEYPGLTAEERRADVTVFVGALPEVVPETGNLILLDTPLPDFLPAEIRGVDAAPEVWDWDRDHVLNRFLNWRDLPLPAAKILKLQGATPIVETFEGPLIAAFDLPERRVVYIAFDMLAELFPFRLAFPILFRNAIAWFEVEEDELVAPLYQPGEVIQPQRRVSADRAHVQFQGQDGQLVTRALEVRDGRFFFEETEEPGPYVVRVSGIPHPTAVNLFAEGESRIAPDTPRVDGLRPETGGHLLNRDLWSILAALALALWTVEWFTYHRRLTE